METEGKAKVVASVWGAEFIQFLAVLAILPWSIWKKRINSTLSSKWTEAKQLALCFSLHSSSMSSNLCSWK